MVSTGRDEGGVEGRAEEVVEGKSNRQYRGRYGGPNGVHTFGCINQQND